MSRNYSGLGRYEQLFDQLDALQTSWDPPYRSHHQRWDETPSEQARRQRFRELRPLDPGLPYGKRDPEMSSPEESHHDRHSTGPMTGRLGQPRQAPWDLPGQRRSRGVRTYDQPQPPHLRGMPSRLERPKQQTYRHTRHYTGMENYEQLFDQLDATGANTTPIGTHGGSRNAGKDVVDPITQGFDMMREYFERLEYRLGRPNPSVAGPVVTEVQDPATTGQPFGEDDDWEMDNRDLGFRRNYFGDDRNPTVGLRNHPSRNRRDYTAPPAGFRGRGDRHQIRRGGPDVDRRDQRRQRTNWDPAPRYREEWDDEEPWDDRGPTNWDPPPRRGGFDRQYQDHPREISRRAPHFDGSEAPNWNSRVQYYFDRRVTNLQASKAASRRDSSNYDTDPYQQHQNVDSDYRLPRHRPTCWDPPSRTSARHVGEIRASPLPEPPPQSAPDLLHGPPPCGTSDTYASEHTARSSFWARGFPPADSATPNHPLTTISNHSHTPSQPQLVLDQQPPLQHLLDQQPQPSHRRAAAPSAPAAAPHPPLHVDQHRTPSCRYSTTNLRQAETCLELSTTVQQPLLQHPSSCLHPLSLHSATKLVSCDEKYLGIEGDSKVFNQVDLRLNEKKLVDEEVRAIEVNKIDEDDGLLDSSTIATFVFDGGLAMTYETRLDADAFSLMYPSIKTEKLLMYPSIKTEKLQNLYFVELHDAWREMVNGLQDRSFLDAMQRTFDIRDVYIKHMIVGYWGAKQQSRAFDPRGVASPKYIFAKIVILSWFPP